MEPYLYLVTSDGSGLGNLVRYLRDRKGLTQTQLGDAVGVKFTTISEIERGAKTTIETLLGIARALDVTAEETRQLFELAGFSAAWRFLSEKSAALGVKASPHDVIEGYDRLSSERRAAARRMLKALESEQASEDNANAGEVSDARLLRNEDIAAEGE